MSITDAHTYLQHGVKTGHQEKDILILDCGDQLVYDLMTNELCEEIYTKRGGNPTKLLSLITNQ